MENVKTSTALAEGTTVLDIAKLKKNREELMRFFRAFRSPAEEPLKLIVGGQGNCACTDGKAIYLPVGVVAGLDDDRDTALALSLHELGHVLYTDFEPQADAIRETAKDWKQKYENDHPAHPDAKVSGKALEQGIQLVFNAIEDGRIEALMASDGATGAAALFNGLLTSTLPEILKLGLGQAGAARELAAKEAGIIAKSGGFMGLGMLAVFTATNIRNKFPPLADPVRSIGLEKARLVTAKVLAAWASAKSGRPAAGIEADLASLPKAGFFLNGKTGATDSWLIFEIVKMCSDRHIKSWLAEAYRVIGEELCEECLEEDDDAQQEGQSQQGQSQQGQSQQGQSQQGQSQQGQSQQGQSQTVPARTVPARTVPARTVPARTVPAGSIRAGRQRTAVRLRLRLRQAAPRRAAAAAGRAARPVAAAAEGRHEGSLAGFREAGRDGGSR